MESSIALMCGQVSPLEPSQNLAAVDGRVPCLPFAGDRLPNRIADRLVPRSNSEHRDPRSNDHGSGQAGEAD